MDTEQTFKYDEEGPALRPGEPFFFLRAQDVLAPYAVREYATLLRAAAAGAANMPGALDVMPGYLREQADEVDRIASRMIAWQATNSTKLPD